MTGFDLKNIIIHSGLDIATVAAKSGIPERTLYAIFKKDVVENFRIKQLNKAGLNLQEVVR